MSESTQTEHTSDSPASYGYCSWHQRFAGGVVLINIIEQGSGPGAVHYACAPCIEQHRLVPFTD